MANSSTSILVQTWRKLYQMIGAKLLVVFLGVGGLMYFAVLTFPPIINITDAVVSLSDDHQKCPDRSKDSIPHIIHQQWKTNQVPEKWRSHTEKCHQLNPTYNYTLWTDEAILKFLETHYEWFVPTFKSYPYPIQRIDSARYFILYHYGGVYIDMDIECRKSFDDIIKNASSKADVILGATAPVGITNNFMMAKKRHSFFQLMTFGLIAADKWYMTPHWTVMMSAGPLYVYHTYLKYLCKAQVHIASVAEHREFFTHEQAATWHSWDGHIMIFLDRHHRFIITIVIIVLVILLLYLVHRCLQCMRTQQNQHYDKLVTVNATNGYIKTDHHIMHKISLGVNS